MPLKRWKKVTIAVATWITFVVGISFILTFSLPNVIVASIVATVVSLLSPRISDTILDMIFGKERIDGDLLDQRRRHYGRLSDNIFKPLKDHKPETPQLSLTTAYWERPREQRWNSLRLDYDASHIWASPYFEDAQKHLTKDVPTFIPTLLEVESSVKRLNNEVNAFITTTRTKVKDTLSKIAPITDCDDVPPNSIYIPSVMTILEYFWSSTILYRYSKNRNLDVVLAGLTSDDIERKEEHASTGWFLSGGIGVAMQLSSEASEHELALAIKKLMLDEDILNKIVEFAERKKELETKGCKLAEEIGKIVHRIESEHYDTVCDCCPK